MSLVKILLSIALLSVPASARAAERALSCAQDGPVVRRLDTVTLKHEGRAEVAIALAYGDGGFGRVCRSAAARYEETDALLVVEGSLDCGEEGYGPYGLHVDLKTMRALEGHRCAWGR
jgi:hypothetical protein